MKTLTITIKKDGETVIDVDGVKGSSCTDLTNLLTNRIGEVKSQELKQSYYDEERPDYVENMG